MDQIKVSDNHQDSWLNWTLIPKLLLTSVHCTENSGFNWICKECPLSIFLPATSWLLWNCWIINASCKSSGNLDIKHSKAFPIILVSEISHQGRGNAPTNCVSWAEWRDSRWIAWVVLIWVSCRYIEVTIVILSDIGLSEKAKIRKGIPQKRFLTPSYNRMLFHLTALDQLIF